MRGMRLVAPPGLSLRPTGDRVRKAVFDLLGPEAGGEAVLDLFSGSGALAIEALSRGYRRAVLVERDRRALAAIERNLKNCGLVSRARVVAEDVAGYLGRSAPEEFSLILADPPYRQAWVPRLLDAVIPGGWLDKDGWLVLECEAGCRPQEKPAGLCLEKFRTYGRTSLLLYRAG